MNISVTGPRQGEVDRDLAFSVRSAIRSFAKQLGINRLKINLNIRVHKSAIFKDGAVGWCEADSNRDFNIDIALYSNWMGVLAHEMVHVKQFARNELSMNMSRWKSNFNVSKLEYENQPWEREAFRRQYEMVKQYDLHGV